jgi:predicted dehydrogenase
MWRHSPQTQAVLDRLPLIGEIRVIRATFAFPLSDPVNIRLRPELDGGSLMDVGCYCVSGARLLAGQEPDRVYGEQVVGPTGAEIAMRGLLHFPSGLTALIASSFQVGHQGLEVIGTQGSIRLPDPWHARAGVLVVTAGGREETVRVAFRDPYGAELEDMVAAIRGQKAPRLGRADALGQARTIDALYRSASSGEAVALG